MPGRRPGPGVVRGAVVSALLLAAGCGDSPVSIDQSAVSDAEHAACETLVDALPDEVAGEQSRLVSPAAARGAAWGDPPIVLTCGVALPASFDELAQCVEADGVGWFVPPEGEADPSADVTIVAAGYRPIVSVELPAEYRPEGVAAVMAELAAPVDEHLELVDECA